MQCDFIRCTCQSLQDTVFDNTPLCYTYRALSVSIVLQVRMPGIVCMSTSAWEGKASLIKGSTRDLCIEQYANWVDMRLPFWQLSH